jgi:tetratricopeptide (TPR) repeat protein
LAASGQFACAKSAWRDVKKGGEVMKHPSKSILFAAIALGCAAMMLPNTADARGGGGGGGRGGGGGGGGRSMGGMSRGVGGAGTFRGAPSNGGANFRSGNFNNNFNRGFVGRGSGWNRWNGNRGWGGWGGWWIGPAYWGFGSPYWYGGYPFWYDTLASGAYVNPYYTNAYDYGGYDYGVPIAQNPNQNQSQNQPAQDDPHFAAARAAFYAGNYQEALREITQAVADMPTSDDIHEFHGLVLFAMGDYQKAAAVAHTTLDAGPGWNWSVVQTLYPSTDTFTQQLRALEHYISEHPDQAATRFLLGYEYLTLGHLKAARRQFDRVVALEPRDTLAKNIVAGLARAPGVTQQDTPAQTNMPPGGPSGPAGGGTPTMNGLQGPGNQRLRKVGPSGDGAGPANQGPDNAGPTGDNAGPVNQGPANGPSGDNAGPATNGPPQPPQPSNPPANPGNAAALSGSWKSSPAPGVTIEATLKPDKHFTWKFTEGGQTKSFTGTYTQQGDNLVLTRDEDGQKMDGTVTMNGDKGFRFRLRNTDPNDPGLDFAK